MIWRKDNHKVVLRLPDSWSNWNLEVLFFEKRKEKNLVEQGGEPTTNSTHIWRQHRDLNPGHIGGKWALSALCHPCSQMIWNLKILINEERETSSLMEQERVHNTTHVELTVRFEPRPQWWVVSALRNAPPLPPSCYDCYLLTTTKYW